METGIQVGIAQTPAIGTVYRDAHPSEGLSSKEISDHLQPPGSPVMPH